jgi:hypothetical protein
VVHIDHAFFSEVISRERGCGFFSIEKFVWEHILRGDEMPGFLSLLVGLIVGIYLADSLAVITHDGQNDSIRNRRVHRELPVESPIFTGNEKVFDVTNPDYFWKRMGDSSNNGEYVSSSGMDEKTAPREFSSVDDVNTAVLEGGAEVEAPTRLEMQVKNAKRIWRAKKEFEEQPKFQNAVKSLPVDAHSKENVGIISAIPNAHGPTATVINFQNSRDEGKVGSTGKRTESVQRVHQDPSAIAAPVGSGGSQQAAAPAADLLHGPKPKGWDQCVKFARNIKGNGVTGLELVRTWKSTCEPSVLSGAATERYKLMCNSLGGVVEPFSVMPDYNVFALCDAVLTVFHSVLAQ